MLTIICYAVALAVCVQQKVLFALRSSSCTTRQPWW